jgi:putative transposase
MRLTVAELTISYRGCHFPGTIIAYAVWLYLSFPLSFRDVEALLAERGTLTKWRSGSGARGTGCGPQWTNMEPDSCSCRSGGIPTPQCGSSAGGSGTPRALPERITTDWRGSYAAALRRLPEVRDVEHLQVRSALRCNNRVEQAHQPTK